MLEALVTQNTANYTQLTVSF